MRLTLDKLAVLAQIAVRNLIASPWKTAIMGGIIGFGAFLVVVGTSLLDGVDSAMRGSITGSVAGHIQVYSRDSRDALELMGGLDMDVPDLEPIEDFAALRAALAPIPGIKTIVPMAIGNAVVNSGNSADQALSELRTLVNERASGAGSPELERRYRAQKELVLQVLRSLGRNFEDSGQIESERAVSADDRALMTRVQSPVFWAEFDADPYRQLELLENRVAPLAIDAEPVLLRYVGTDPERFAASFERMRIVDGEQIPRGQRGFMFSKYVYEDQIKLKAARGLDKLIAARDLRGARIDREPDLQRIVRENIIAAREIMLQLDPLESEVMRRKLQSYLHSSEPQVNKLFARFFDTRDADLGDRHAFFYRELAPLLELYRIRIGDTLTIKAVSRGGYMQTAAVRVYGTFAFDGLEQSPQAGALNMIDLVSFRELYGFVTAEREKEIETMRASVGVRDIARKDVEAELFGALQLEQDSSATPAARAPSAAAAQAPAPFERAVRRTEHYDQAQLESGVVLNAAILLEDEDRLPETMEAIERAAATADLPLKVVSWQTAAGLTGQFATLMRAVLFTAVTIIFFVALVIINNALVMTTLERVGEIGMLRAIGAQRSVVLAILLLESTLVGVLAGAAGGALGVALVARLSRTGIPAVHETLRFFFAGPRLYPMLGAPQLALALALVLLVSIASGLYPALLAMRVSPREAMQPEE